MLIALIVWQGGNNWLLRPVARPHWKPDNDLTCYVAITEDGVLMIQNEWTEDGHSSSGYKYFRRQN